jgi:hypothetical protein
MSRLALFFVAVLCALAPARAAAQTGTYVPPRTSDGHPDLQGVWQVLNTAAWDIHHSEALHVVERYTRTGADHIAYEVTIEDPQVFTRSWKMSMTLYRRQEPAMELLEYECFAYKEAQRGRDLRNVGSRVPRGERTSVAGHRSHQPPSTVCRDNTAQVILKE